MKRKILLSVVALACVVLISSLNAQTPTQATTATIHVYREKHSVGFAISPSIYVDGIELQRLRNGTFFVANLPTGKHMITAGRSEVGLFVEFGARQAVLLQNGSQELGWHCGFRQATHVPFPSTGGSSGRRNEKLEGIESEIEPLLSSFRALQRISPT
jgi:hypothetical protein